MASIKGGVANGAIGGGVAPLPLSVGRSAERTVNGRSGGVGDDKGEGAASPP